MKRTYKSKKQTDSNITLYAVPGVGTGEIELLWQPSQESSTYIIQMNLFTRSHGLWKHADIVTRSKYTATGLKSGKKYSFRVAPVNKNGQQEWSLPVIAKAP